MICTFSKLNPKGQEQLQMAEKQLGKTLIAVTRCDSEPAAMTEEELVALRKLEKELGVVLLAVD